MCTFLLRQDPVKNFDTQKADLYVCKQNSVKRKTM